ncbi:MAG: hypothetical protein H0U65_03180 [Rubrobacter sp.]|nr:hypothetical protein [Rubrobacter sp.]
MNREEFEKAVENSAGPELQDSDALKIAVYERGRRGSPFYNQEIHQTLRAAADKKVDFDLAAEEVQDEHTRRSEPGAEALFISQMLVKSLASWTVGLRAELGHGDPPFESLGEAADYIETTSREGMARWNENREDPDSGPHRFLPYVKPNDCHRKSVPVAPGTSLAKLAGEVERVSRWSGLLPDALTSHVLTGVMPRLSRVRSARHDNSFNLPSGQQVRYRYVTLTFRTSDLTFDELRMLYGEIKEYMGGKGVRSTDLDNFEFWELVCELGSPPEPYKGVRQYWIHFRDRWNAAHPQRAPLKSWEGFQDRYQRLCDRFGMEVAPSEGSGFSLGSYQF